MKKDIFSWQEFKPTILFLIKFIGIYIVGNLLYGFYIDHFDPRPDPITHEVSRETAWVLTLTGWPTFIQDHTMKPTTLLLHEEKSILAVYEGCNGINTMIIFVAFILAFGPLKRTWLWFVPLGIVIIHLMNLLRIILLFYVSEYMPHFMYFTHKYLFTASLYGVIFLLWLWWIKRYSIQRT
ncbi:MAG TPA: exosortase family protein XrtF [Ohtaekwangia sp.]|uniref:exosortase family protein XrtF n=1 Tax=Ohtaekwangia sp. TaxID=2066019 RepID=UPI002F934BC3